MPCILIPLAPWNSTRKSLDHISTTIRPGRGWSPISIDLYTSGAVCHDDGLRLIDAHDLLRASLAIRFYRLSSGLNPQSHLLVDLRLACDSSPKSLSETSPVQSAQALHQRWHFCSKAERTRRPHLAYPLRVGISILRTALLPRHLGPMGR